MEKCRTVSLIAKKGCCAIPFVFIREQVILTLYGRQALLSNFLLAPTLPRRRKRLQMDYFLMPNHSTS
jgi:hypothetical protein